MVGLRTNNSCKGPYDDYVMVQLCSTPQSSLKWRSTNCRGSIRQRWCIEYAFHSSAREPWYTGVWMRFARTHTLRCMTSWAQRESGNLGALDRNAEQDWRCTTKAKMENALKSIEISQNLSNAHHGFAMSDVMASSMTHRSKKTHWFMFFS